MGPNPQLEATIDKILAQSEADLLSGLRRAHAEAEEMLSGSRQAMEDEYDRILDDGKKEADKVSRQIIGGADLRARNRLLLLAQESIARVFDEAAARVRAADRSGPEYAALLEALVKESVEALGTDGVTVRAAGQDREAAGAALEKFPGAELSPDPVDCLGGVRAESKDGSMSYDNTIDSRIERMKPLIRKEIAAKFGMGGGGG